MAEYILYGLISGGGKHSPIEYGYYIVPLFNEKHSDDRVIWIQDNIDGMWSYFHFGAYIESGVSYCFDCEEDAFRFKLRWL